MIQVRKACDRGFTRLKWLESYHSFSFGSYYDPEHMGHGVLRVINDDRVKAGAGFGTHPHENMEILTFVLEGELEHKDSMGNGSVIKAGDVQRMSAGTGVLHSEFNPSDEYEVRFLQVWILPNERNLNPGYQQRSFSKEQSDSGLKLLVSQSPKEDSVSINQDVSIFGGNLHEDCSSLNYSVGKSRSVWLQILTGTLDLNGETLHEGDGALVDELTQLDIQSVGVSRFLIFDIPGTL